MGHGGAHTHFASVWGAGVLAWPTRWRVLAVAPAVLALWAAVAWALTEI
ncbi:MAG: hypothetical protein Fur007_03890 [Rhodoferax sp.]